MMRSNIPSGTVTFLFTDIEGSTRLLEALRDQYETLLGDHHRILRGALPRWNGHEITTEGDSFFIAFARAIDAVNFVIETQHQLAEHLWPQAVAVRVRMGLHTGEPLLSQSGIDDDTLDQNGEFKPSYIGMDIHRAARIADSGHGGQVLLSQTTRDLIFQDLPLGISLRYLGKHTLKDISYPQPIYQLVIAGLQSEFPPLKTLAIHPEPALLDARLDEEPDIDSSRVEIEAYRALLKRMQAQGRTLLDRPSLAILLAAPAGLTFNSDELAWLLRSALQENFDLQPWINRADTPAIAVNTLQAILSEYPRPQTRLMIVRCLCKIPGPEATEILLQVSASDDSHEVRTTAALEAARRGRLSEVQRILSRAAGKEDDPTVLPALVAVIDEYGSLPHEFSDYPRLAVGLRLVQRRWLRNREAAVRRTLRSGIGGAFAMAIIGSVLPLLATIVEPSTFESNMELFSVAAWVIAGIFVGLVWGGLQGLASGAAISLADVIWAPKAPPAWRFVFGGLAGLVFALFFILFSSARLFSPPTSPGVYVPVFLVYGFIQGGALSWVIPGFDQRYPRNLLTLKCLQASVTIALVSLPLIYIAYQELMFSRLPLDWLYALLLPAGLGLATNRE